jgi:hypothetical protein
MLKHRLYLAVMLLVIGSIQTFTVGCSRLQDTSPTAQPSLTSPPSTRADSTPAAGSPIQVPAAPPGQELAMLPQSRGDLSGLNLSAIYSIDLQVDYQERAFQGRMQLDYTNQDSVTHDRLYFRLLPNAHKSYGNGWLEVLSAEVEGQPIETQLSLSGSVLELVLPEPVRTGQSIRIEMDFAGQAPVDFGGGEAPEGYGIYNFSDNVLTLSGWYPILSVFDDEGWNLDPVSAIGDSVYSETAFYNVDVTTDDDLLVAATGVEVSSEQEAGDFRRQYVSGPVRDFTMVMSPDFELTSEVVGGVRLNTYYLPGHKLGGEKALQVTSASLQIFNQRFGEYPFVELDVVEAPMRNALGVEYPGIFLVASDLYDDPQQDSFLIATAHEVAHQWWYSLVGNDVFDEPWLDESLATYSSSLYYQESLGEAAYRGFAAYWQERLDALREDGQDDQINRSLAYYESLDAPRVYGTVVYTKGALFLKALREEIGDQAFFGALTEYYRQYKYDVADAATLLEIFEHQSGRSLDDFYQEWLYYAEK